MVELDLFKLHDTKEDKRPLSWISAFGPNLSKTMKQVLNELCTELKKIEIDKKLSSQLNISISTTQCIRYNKKWIPIIYLEKLLQLWKKELSKSTEEVKFRRNEIISTIEYLKVNNSLSKPMKAVKELNETLCKIAGAHTADGTLHVQLNLFSSSYNELVKLQETLRDINYKLPHIRKYRNDYRMDISLNSSTKDKVIQKTSNFCSGLHFLIRITDGDRNSIRAYKNWIENIFEIKLPKIKPISKNEWNLEFVNKIIGRYFNKFFHFPYGKKVYETKVPEIIKNAGIELKKAFVIGVLTFEAGIGIRNQVEFCVVSKELRDDIVEILEYLNMDIKSMKKSSLGYWRFWSEKLSKDSYRWLELFEPNTEKWFKIYEITNGYQYGVNTVEDAVRIFDEIYPTKSGNKVSMKDVIEIILEMREVYRYKLVDALRQKNGLKNFGGKWAHSVSYYLEILKRANIISIRRGKFGKKKSFGTIIREIYQLNPDIKSWKVPHRPWLQNEVNYVQ